MGSGSLGWLIPRGVFAQFLGAVNEFVVRGDHLFFEHEMARLHVVNIARPEHFGEEIEGDVLIPRPIEPPVGLERLVAVMANDDVVVAVPEELDGDVAAAYFLIVEEDQGVGRLGGDLDGASDAGGLRQDESKDKGNKRRSRPATTPSPPPSEGRRKLVGRAHPTKRARFLTVGALFKSKRGKHTGETPVPHRSARTTAHSAVAHRPHGSHSTRAGRD